jgi:hypothetical protein
MRHPKPFTVTQNGKPIFTIHAYSLDQAGALVAAKVASETIVVAVRVVPLTSSLLAALDGAGQ